MKIQFSSQSNTTRTTSRDNMHMQAPYLLLFLINLTTASYFTNPPKLILEKFEWLTSETIVVPTFDLQVDWSLMLPTNRQQQQRQLKPNVSFKLCFFISRSDKKTINRNIPSPQNDFVACIAAPKTTSSLVHYNIAPKWNYGFDATTNRSERINYKIRTYALSIHKDNEDNTNVPLTWDQPNTFARHELHIDVQTSCCVQHLRRTPNFLEYTGLNTGKPQWSWTITKIWRHSPLCSLCESSLALDQSIHMLSTVNDSISNNNNNNSFQIAQSSTSVVEKASLDLGIAARDQLSLGSAGRSLFGMPFHLVGVGHGDRILLDAALGVAKQNFPERGLNIVEFGTFRGVTSLYLGMAAHLWNGRFDTFDIKDMRTQDVKRAWLSNTMHANYLNLEKLPAPQPDGIAARTVKSADFFFVDGGHKDLEVYMYNHYATVGTVMYVHDMDYVQYHSMFSFQTLHENNKGSLYIIYDILKTFGWRPILTQTAVEVNSCGRVWIREKVQVPKIGSSWYITKNDRIPDTLEMKWTKEGGQSRVYDSTTEGSAEKKEL